MQDAAYCGDETWNGCGPGDIPDFLIDAADSVSGFQDACNNHDVCYGNCGRSRAECDSEFLDDMNAECDAGSGFLGPLCTTLADIVFASLANSHMSDLGER